jgi:membrane associated rhomboid family serine protease
VGIYDRDYYRDDPRSSWGGIGTPTGVKFLIAANVIVYLLQIFVVQDIRPPRGALQPLDPGFEKIVAKLREADPRAADELERRIRDDNLDIDMMANFPGTQVSPITEWLQLDTNRVIHKFQIWRLVTHAFCHDRYGLWHILFNMLALFWFGPTLESMYGTREFLLFYFTAIVAAALAYIGLDLVTGTRYPAVGASGAIMAVIMLYAWHFPTSEILVMWVIPVQIRFVVVIYALWDLHPVLLALTGDRIYTGVGNVAHLGGLAFGFLYAKCEWHLSSLVARLTPANWGARLPRRRPRLRIAPETVPPPDNPDADEVDRILRKISQSGQASLSDEELATLHRASKKAKKQKAGEEDRYPWE